jgi:hypothetical protein
VTELNETQIVAAQLQLRCISTLGKSPSPSCSQASGSWSTRCLLSDVTSHTPMNHSMSLAPKLQSIKPFTIPVQGAPPCIVVDVSTLAEVERRVACPRRSSSFEGQSAHARLRLGVRGGGALTHHQTCNNLPHTATAHQYSIRFRDRRVDSFNLYKTPNDTGKWPLTSYPSCNPWSRGSRRAPARRRPRQTPQAPPSQLHPRRQTRKLAQAALTPPARPMGPTARMPTSGSFRSELSTAIVARGC